MTNFDLMDKSMTFVLDHPEQHDQNTWLKRDPVCGTVGCFAGHAVRLAGLKVEWRQRQPEPLAEYPVVVTGPNPEDFDTIHEVAMKVLDIDHLTSSAMFCAHNTQDDLQTMVKMLHNGQRVDRCPCYGTDWNEPHGVE